MARRLADLVEGYRWLWSAQRRWHPGSRWVAAPLFVLRVLADIMRSVVPSRPPRLSAKQIALVSVLLFFALVLGVPRGADRDFEPAAVTWADTTGGFEVVFPADWVATEPARDERRPAMTGSAHRRPAGGTLLRRHLTARVFDLGVIPPGITTRNLAALASGIRAPGETIVRPALARQGVYVAAYRSAGSANDGSSAVIFFRGRDGHGFMLEITGHREDETLLVDEAFSIADSLRHDQLVLSDMAIRLAQSFLVPPEALEQARAMQVDVGMTRSVVGPLPTPTQSRRLGLQRPVVNANLFLDTGTGSARDDECRARAVLLFSEGLPALPEIFLRPVELRVTCQTSTVSIGVDLLTAPAPHLLLRQLDLAGRLIYEESVRAELFLGLG
jgi:hypothetical protein